MVGGRVADLSNNCISYTQYSFVVFPLHGLMTGVYPRQYLETLRA